MTDIERKPERLRGLCLWTVCLVGPCLLLVLEFDIGPFQRHLKKSQMKERRNIYDARKPNRSFLYLPF